MPYVPVRLNTLRTFARLRSLHAFKIYASLSLAHLSAIKQRQKKALEHFKHVIKTCTDRGNIFQNKLQNKWLVILKASALLRL